MTELPITKAGLVPFRFRACGAVEFLLHKPKPKYNPQDDVPFGLCRGTRRYREAGALVDARTPETLTHTQIDALESLSATALNEGEEELGLHSRDLRRIIDMDAMDYKSLSKAPYPVHWFLAEVKATAQPKAPKDAAATAWKTLPEMREMASEKRFKIGYIEVLEKAEALLAHESQHQHHGDCDCAQTRD